MKQALVYSLPDCPRCVHAKNVLTHLGYDVEERSAEALERGEYKDHEALTELAYNDGAVPVVIVDGRSVRKGDDLHNLIQEHKEW